MNRRFRLLFFLVALAFPSGSGPLLWAQDVEESPDESVKIEELVRNGNFSRPNEIGEWPKDWGSHSPGSGKTWETEKEARYLRLLSQKPGQLQVLYRSLNLTPGKIGGLQVTVRYRTQAVKPGQKTGSDARALFIFRDSSGGILDSNTPSLLFKPDASDWTEVSGRILVPQNATKWVMMIGLFGADGGRIDIGEIKAVPLDETETAALVSAAGSRARTETISWIGNGDFSKAGADDQWPAEWGKPAPGMSWEKESEQRFIRLRGREPGQVLMVHKTIPLQPGTPGIELKIRFRTSGILYGEHEWFDARTIVHFLGADGERVDQEGGLDFVFGHKPEPTGWMERVKSYVVPQGATQLQLMSGLFKARAGTVDLAEIQVTPMNEANTELLKITNTAYRIWKDDENAAMERRISREIATRLEATGNLLPNGGFEVADPNGGAEGWGKGDPENGLALREEEGEHFMRLVSNDPTRTRLLYRMIPLPLESRAIEIKVRYRTADIAKGDRLPGDARAIMHFMNGTRFGHLENGKQISPSPPDLIFSSKAGEWTELTRRYLVPEGATKLQFMPGLWNVKTGTLDLADLRVAPLPEAEAQAMVDARAAALQKKAERAAVVEKDLARPAITPELKVSGNQLLGPDGKAIWLQGLCVDSLQWCYGENILWSIRVAIDDWKANVIRLPVSPEFWFGRADYQKPGDEDSYRRAVDDAIQMAASKGAWVALDLHTFGAPTEKHLNFWKDAAVRYKNNPAVLFELFNEPHSISWEIWRSGGSLKGPANPNTDVNPSENTAKMESDTSTGMQALVAAIRQTGAKNIIIAGGLDWGYDLGGVVKDYPLDDLGGNGIVYSSHIYPWKSDWQGKVLDAAQKYPLFIGEVGTPPDYSTFQFIPESSRHPIEGWAVDVIAFMQKNKLNWTGFSFHPQCGPMAIQDWDYTPTPYWGIYVKKALAGQQFEMQKMR